MPHQLSNLKNLAYALPVIAISCLMAPVGILQGIYAKYFGFPLASIAMVLLAVRLFDAISDPVVGYFSDRYYNLYGTYKPFIVFGGLIFSISSWFLYSPPSDVKMSYFMFWFIAFYAAWTVFEIPHIAWASKLATSSDDKAKIYSFRTSALYAGLLLFYVIPLLPIFETQAITPETLKISAMVVAVVMLPFLLLCVKTAESFDKAQSLRLCEQHATQSSRVDIRSMLHNKPLLIFIGAILTTFISSGLWYSLIFLYVDVYLGMGEQFAKIFLLAFLIGMVTTPFWYKLALRFGKKTTWVFTTCLAALSFIYTGMLAPGSTTIFELAILKSIQTLGFTGTGVLMPAILSEIVDFSHWKYRSENSAIYFSTYTLVNKSAMSIATALGLGIAGWYGFDATINTQSDQSIFGLKLMISWLPIMFAFLNLVFILLLPINERRHHIIRRRLDLRGKRFSQKITAADSAASFSPA